ncbi:MAG: hypothetical protein C4558_06320 [Dehalococcoidia bacterium]|nr:MAG: hypothetical protein C4558_06320 [Dehalococcoidia bacterium]
MTLYEQLGAFTRAARAARAVRAASAALDEKARSLSPDGMIPIDITWASVPGWEEYVRLLLEYDAATVALADHLLAADVLAEVPVLVTRSVP